MCGGTGTDQELLEDVVVGDDAVVHDHEGVGAVGRVRVRVDVARRAVGGPPRVRDADVIVEPLQRRLAQARLSCMAGDPSMQVTSTSARRSMRWTTTTHGPDGERTDGSITQDVDTAGALQDAQLTVAVVRVKRQSYTYGARPAGKTMSEKDRKRGMAGQPTMVVYARPCCTRSGTGRIVAAVLEAAQAVEQGVHDERLFARNLVVEVGEYA